MGEILLWKMGTESSTMAAFLAIEMSLNEIDEVSFTVSIVSRLTMKPRAACRRREEGRAERSGWPQLAHAAKAAV